MEKRQRGQQMAWWLPGDLIARIKEYRHAEQIDTVTESVRRLLEAALDQWSRTRAPAPGQTAPPRARPD